MNVWYLTTILRVSICLIDIKSGWRFSSNGNYYCRASRQWQHDHKSTSTCLTLCFIFVPSFHDAINNRQWHEYWSMRWNTLCSYYRATCDLNTEYRKSERISWACNYITFILFYISLSIVRYNLRKYDTNDTKEEDNNWYNWISK